MESSMIQLSQYRLARAKEVYHDSETLLMEFRTGSKGRIKNIWKSRIAEAFEWNLYCHRFLWKDFRK